MNISIHQSIYSLKKIFCVKTINCIKSNFKKLIDIICSFIVDKYINHLNHYESLSLSKGFFNNLNFLKKIKFHKPKINGFVNYNTYKFMENWLNKEHLSYSPIRNSKHSQLGTSVMA